MISRLLFDNPVKLERCTGLTPVQFQTLAARVTPLWQEAERERLFRDNRVRRMGAGHPYGLKTIEEKVFAALLWYKLYPAFWFLGMTVGLDAANACRLVGRLRPLIEQAADPTLATFLTEKVRIIKRRSKPISSWEELQKEFPDVAEILIDATEQQRLRPKRRVQKRYYSGKKKRHTLKTQLVVNQEGRILDVSKTYPGRVHDFELLQKEGTIRKIPPAAKTKTDRGYTGIKKKYPNYHFLVPVKRNRWKRFLTRSEKIFNSKLSKQRVVVEHVLSRVKKYRILSDVFRGRVRNYNQDFRNVAAITNFRLALATT